MLVAKYSNPEKSIYYQASLILDIIKKLSLNTIDSSELYLNVVKQKGNLSYSQYLLALNWLYLLGIIDLNNNGVLVVCI
jgi:hypothetical protein